MRKIEKYDGEETNTRDSPRLKFHEGRDKNATNIGIDKDVTSPVDKGSPLTSSFSIYSSGLIDRVKGKKIPRPKRDC